MSITEDIRTIIELKGGLDSFSKDDKTITDQFFREGYKVPDFLEGLTREEISVSFVSGFIGFCVENVESGGDGSKFIIVNTSVLARVLQNIQPVKRSC